jgi:hypothetical protein
MELHGQCSGGALKNCSRDSVENQAAVVAAGGIPPLVGLGFNEAACKLNTEITKAECRCHDCPC